MRFWRSSMRLGPTLAAVGVGLLLLGACDDNGEPEVTPTPAVERPTVPPDSMTTVQITMPEEGNAVPIQTRVEVMVEPNDQGLNLQVLVRPIPDDPNQDYWVQAEPGPIDGGLWASDPVFVGIEPDPPGLPFKVCAVITDKNVARGDRLRTLPTGPSDCVNVTRQ